LARTPGGLSDEALLAGLTFGDGKAALAFVQRFQSRVFGLALSILRDPALAEDIAQEAFLRAWRHGASYDPRRGTVAAWLLRITRNLAIDALRLRRAEVMDPDVLAAVAPPGDASVEEAAMISTTAAAVQQALRSLPEE
jgi:RNA polymerase sigma-70 factor (ECF subfamily)